MMKRFLTSSIVSSLMAFAAFFASTTCFLLHYQSETPKALRK